jgi:hypothetical protein
METRQIREYFSGPQRSHQIPCCGARSIVGIIAKFTVKVSNETNQPNTKATRQACDFGCMKPEIEQEHAAGQVNFLAVL